jgi:hypothetical protein
MVIPPTNEQSFLFYKQEYIYIHVQSSFRSEIFVRDCLQEFMFDMQVLQGKFCKAEQDCFGTPGQTETSLKFEDLRSNKTTGKSSTRIQNSDSAGTSI